MQIILSLLLVILPILGMADSGYLTYEKLSGAIPACGEGFDCGSVLQSEWAMVGPIPLSALGFLFYLTVFVFGVLNYLEFDLGQFLKKKLDKRLKSSHPLFWITTKEVLLTLSIIGGLFSLFLVFLMGVILKAWCLYCLISAGLSGLIFVVASLQHNHFAKKSPVLVRFLMSGFLGFGYRTLVKPLLFLFPADLIHHAALGFGRKLGKFRITQAKTSLAFNFQDKRLARKIDGIQFPNQVGLAAGFDYNGDLVDILPSLGFGFHTVGTVTWEPNPGNPKPQLGRYPKSNALLVNKGFKSIGAKAVVQKLQDKNPKIPLGISIGATNKVFESGKDQIEDMIKSFKLFEKSKVKHSYYELNISCPNLKVGEPFTSPARLETLLRAVEKLQIKKPIYVKMPIDQTLPMSRKLLKVIERFTIAGVIFGNLAKDRNNKDVKKEDRKAWKKAKGNLSGKPTWKRSNRAVKLAAEEFGDRFTVIGTGGIFTGEDAQEKIELGADLVQLIAGMIFQGPQTIGQINSHLLRNLD